MTSDSINQAVIFYLIAVGLALCVALLGPQLGEAVALLTMFTPLAAVLIVRLVIVRDGWHLTAWRDIGLHRVGLRYWPLALVLPLVILLPGYLMIWAMSDGPAPAFGDALTLQSVVRLLISLLIGAVLGALGEEIGWRGFLQPRLARLGPWRALFLTGFLHGAWHLPLLLLTPFYHGAGSPWLVVPLFLAALTLSGPIYGYLRIASASIWPVALMHRAINNYWEKLDALTPGDTSLLGEYVAGESGLAVIAMLIATTALLWRFWKRGAQ